MPTETTGVDYSFSRPSPAAITKAGHVAVGRYIALGSGKLLGFTEAAQLRKARLGIWLVAEGTAQRAAEGRAAGVADAQAAAKAAQELGYPDHAVLFAAVDFDATPGQVLGYLRGWKSVLGKRAGVYGGIKITSSWRVRRLIPYRWQTAAWSGGKVDPKAHIYQRIQMTRPVPGCDENVLIRPVPMWGGTFPAPPPKPAPRPKPAPARKPHAQPNVDQAIAYVTKAVAAADNPTRKAELTQALALLRKARG